MTAPLTTSLIAIALASILCIGCGPGLSSEEAAEECAAEQDAHPTCMTDKSTAACVSCHEECGDLCGTVATTCPVAFSCPED